MALPASDADALELYRYFPSFVKYRDSEAGVDANGEGILQKITYVLEKEAGAHSELIRRLLYNLDPDSCDLQFLDYLAFIFGERVPGDWGDEKRRGFLRQLPDLLKVKGLHLGFNFTYVNYYVIFKLRSLACEIQRWTIWGDGLILEYLFLAFIS